MKKLRSGQNVFVSKCIRKWKDHRVNKTDKKAATSAKNVMLFCLNDWLRGGAFSRTPVGDIFFRWKMVPRSKIRTKPLFRWNCPPAVFNEASLSSTLSIVVENLNLQKQLFVSQVSTVAWQKPEKNFFFGPIIMNPSRAVALKVLLEKGVCIAQRKHSHCLPSRPWVPISTLP